MTLNRSRKTRINKAPVFEPNSSFGFLRLMPNWVLTALERAGAIFNKHSKERPLNKPPYQYWINKQVIALFIISLLSSYEQCPAFAEHITLKASWYSIESLKKEGTYAYSKGIQANGKLFDENALTCASCDFPLKTKLRVTTIKAPKKSVIVEVTDRTARRFKGKRIDLSRAAMEALGGKQALIQGLIEVSIKEIK